MYETERLIQELAKLTLDVHNIIVNQLIVPDSSTHKGGIGPAPRAFLFDRCVCVWGGWGWQETRASCAKRAVPSSESMPAHHSPSLLRRMGACFQLTAGGRRAAAGGGSRYLEQIDDLYDDFHVIKVSRRPTTTTFAFPLTARLFSAQLPLQPKEVRGLQALTDFSHLMLTPAPLGHP